MGGAEHGIIYREHIKRAAQLLKIDEELMWTDEVAESMQVVHYRDGQMYESHLDWNAFNKQSRYLTLLLYLTTGTFKGGGATAFPRANKFKGFKVHPKKGMAVLFYSLLEDGNGDDLSMHTAMPVAAGHQKWLANFWVWDPHITRSPAEELARDERIQREAFLEKEKELNAEGVESASEGKQQFL